MPSLLSRNCFLNLASYLTLVYGMADQQPTSLPATMFRMVEAVAGAARGWGGGVQATWFG